MNYIMPPHADAGLRAILRSCLGRVIFNEGPKQQSMYKEAKDTFEECRNEIEGLDEE
jgi:hypothetical protein